MRQPDRFARVVLKAVNGYAHPSLRAPAIMALLRSEHRAVVRLVKHMMAFDTTVREKIIHGLISRQDLLAALKKRAR